MRRVKFSEVFTRNPNGTLSPKRIIRVGGITFGPGVTFGKGVSFGGIDFFQYQMNDIAIEEGNDGIWVIKGFYKN